MAVSGSQEPTPEAELAPEESVTEDAETSVEDLVAAAKTPVNRSAQAETASNAAKGAGTSLSDVNGDLHASEEYRRAMVSVFTKRAIEGALARVEPGHEVRECFVVGSLEGEHAFNRRGKLTRSYVRAVLKA